MSGDAELNSTQQRFSDGDADALGRRESTVSPTAADEQDRRGDPLRAERRPGVDVGRRRVGTARATRRCTPTSASSRPRTSSAWPRMGARRPSCSLATKRSAIASRPCTPHISVTTTSRCCSRAIRRAACARRPNAILPTASGRRRHSATRGSRCRVGSDSHAVIDPFEEVRGDRARPATGVAAAAARTGRASCWPRQRARAIAASDGTRVGGSRPARWPTSHRSRSTSPRLAGTDPDHAAAAVVFAATAGRRASRGGRRRSRRGRRGASVDRCRGRARSFDRTGVVMSSPTTVIDNIGRLDHQRRAVRGRRHRSAARRVGGDGRRADRSRRHRAAPIADQRIDAAGRCVLPGFVDSHSHLVFAGDRSDEFAARMAGRPYEAGGIRTSVAATRAATDDELLAAGAVAAGRGARARARRRSRSSRATGSPRHTRLAPCASRRQLTEETTFLGAHVVPPEFDDRVDDYVALVCGEMLAECAPYARWVDAFCERGAFDADQCRAVLSRGSRRGLGHAAARQPTRPRSRRATGRRDGLRVGRSLHLPLRRRHRRAGRQAPPSPRFCPPPISRPASRIPMPVDCSTPAAPRRSPRTATRVRATPRRCRSASRWRCAT